MTTYADLIIALDNIEACLDRFAHPNATNGADTLMGVIVDHHPTLSDDLVLGLEARARMKEVCRICEAYRSATTAAHGKPADHPRWRFVGAHARLLRRQIGQLLPMIEEMAV